MYAWICERPIRVATASAEIVTAVNSHAAGVVVILVVEMMNLDSRS